MCYMLFHIGTVERLFSYFHRRELAPGAVLWRQGEPSLSAVVLVSGTLRIYCCIYCIDCTWYPGVCVYYRCHYYPTYVWHYMIYRWAWEPAWGGERHERDYRHRTFGTAYDIRCTIEYLSASYPCTICVTVIGWRIRLDFRAPPLRHTNCNQALAGVWAEPAVVPEAQQGGAALSYVTR